MVKVTIRNNADSKTMMMDGNTTVREAMAESGMAFSSGTMHLNGTPVLDLDRKINSFGNFEEVLLFSVTDGKNA